MKPHVRQPFSEAELAVRKQRRAEGLNLHAIEGNALDADDIAMFEMFDREGFTDEQRTAYIKAKFTVAPAADAPAKAAE